MEVSQLKNHIEKGPLENVQTVAWNFLQSNGLPAKKNEQWKYTPVQNFLPSKLKEGNKNLVQSNFNLSSSIDLDAKRLKSAEKITDHFQAISLLMNNDLKVVRLEKNKNYESPIELNFSGEELQTHQNIMIIAEEGSKATVVENWNIKGSEFINTSTYLVLEKGAHLEHIIFQQNHCKLTINNVQAQVNRDANLKSLFYTLGSEVTRNNLSVDLLESNATVESYGLYALRDEQHCDNFSLINHRVSNTFSNQLFKGILADKSTGIFTGKVEVSRDAIGVDSAQLNKNLLLSKTAHAYTRPQLEVYADDVKCAHGATVGQISEEELFYLQARGIPKGKALKILGHAFSADVLAHINSENLRKKYEEVLYESFEKKALQHFEKSELR